jgi:serine/threonine protein kinase
MKMTGNGFPDDELDFGQTIQIPRFAPTQKIFRRYILQKILGRGGMGVVWLAMDDQLESLVALKVLPDALCHDRASLEALKRETKLGLRLAHPNIVRIYDFQQDDSAAAISMEFVDGVTLSDVRSEKPVQVFSPSDLQPYVSALCDALNYAHTRRKIVHRDLKPRNLMLDSEKELKIADFGISRSISESMIMVTGKLGSTGSPPYISPQQWDGAQPSPLDDIYSVGATLYELLTSKPPLLGVVDWQQVHFNVPPPMRKRRSDLGITGAAAIPPEWEETIAACLAKDPKDRPQTILEVQARLGKSHVKDSVEEEMTTDDLSDDTIVIPSVPSPPELEAPAAPLIDRKLTMPAVPLVDSKLTIPGPPLTEPKKETTAAKTMPGKIEELPVQAKAEPPLAKVEPSLALPLTEDSPSMPVRESPVPSPPGPTVPAAPLVDPKLTIPGPPLTEPKKETTAARAMPSEIEELPVQAKAEPPLEMTEPALVKAEPPLTLPLTEESRSTPAQESLSASPPVPSPPEEFVARPREEVFLEIPTQPVPQPEVSYPSPRKMPRWMWVAAGAAIFVLCGSFLIWITQSPPKVTSSVVESPPVQSTPNITEFDLNIDSVGKSPDGKQMFPKHVRASINDTAINLKGVDNHWSVDFGGKVAPLPFDLEVSAPGYQPAVVHFEHIDDLKNPSPLRLEREHGNIVIRPSGTSDFVTAQLKMVEALPGQNEDVVVDFSTVVQDLSATTPIVVPTGVYQVAFQSRNGAAVKPTVRVAIQAGAIQAVDVPKPLPGIAAEGTAHPATVVRQTRAPSAVIPSSAVAKTSPAVASVTTTNETSSSANNPTTPVTAAREAAAPPAVIPSPAVATAKEAPSPADIPPAASTAPKESPSLANVPPAAAYAVKESPAPKNRSPPAAETSPRRTKEKAAKYTESKPKKFSEPPTAKPAARPPPVSPKARSTPFRKKAQPFEGGVPGG